MKVSENNSAAIRCLSSDKVTTKGIHCHKHYLIRGSRNAKAGVKYPKHVTEDSSEYGRPMIYFVFGIS